MRSSAHLVRRFFGFITASELSPREQSEVNGLLARAEAALFWEQSTPDQRHALQVARRVLVSRPGDREAAGAALLHDVGKRGLRLGAVHRSVATVMYGLKMPLRGSYEAYRAHGPLGAEALEAVDAGALAVAFARYHPAAAPPATDPEQWQALLDADHA